MVIAASSFFYMAAVLYHGLRDVLAEERNFAAGRCDGFLFVDTFPRSVRTHQIQLLSDACAAGFAGSAYGKKGDNNE